MQAGARPENDQANQSGAWNAPVQVGARLESKKAGQRGARHAPLHARARLENDQADLSGPRRAPVRAGERPENGQARQSGARKAPVRAGERPENSQARQSGARKAPVRAGQRPESAQASPESARAGRKAPGARAFAPAGRRKYRPTRDFKHMMGSPRVGSNPTGVVFVARSMRFGVELPPLGASIHHTISPAPPRTCLQARLPVRHFADDVQKKCCFSMMAAETGHTGD